MKSGIIVQFCEQTHEHCQGYACDDHIETYTVVVPNGTLEQVLKTRELLQTAQERYEQELDEATDEWHKNNPGETECCCEGPEFIGSRWIDWNETDQRPGDWTPERLILELQGWLDGNSPGETCKQDEDDDWYDEYDWREPETYTNGEGI